MAKVSLIVFACVLALAASPTLGLESESFYTWALTDKKLSFPQLAPGAGTGEWLIYGQDTANETLVWTKVTYDDGKVTSNWRQTINCSNGVTCYGTRLMALSGNTDSVYTAWYKSNEDYVYVAELSSATGDVTNLISLEIDNLSRIGVCFGKTTFILIAYQDTTVNMYTIDSSLSVTQYKPFTSSQVTCHPLVGTDNQYISSMDNGVITLAMLEDNTTKKSQYTVTGLDDNYAFVVEASKTMVGARYYKKNTDKTGAELFGYLIMDQDFSIKKSQSWEEAITSPTWNATFSSDEKFAFSFGNLDDQTSRTVVLNDDYDLEIAFTNILGSDEYLAPQTIVFTPGSGEVLNFLGMYSVNKSGTADDVQNGAFQTVSLEDCGKGFGEYEVDLKDVDTIKTEEVKDMTDIFTTTTTTVKIANPSKDNIFTDSTVEFAESSDKVNQDDEYCVTDKKKTTHHSSSATMTATVGAIAGLFTLVFA